MRSGWAKLGERPIHQWIKAFRVSVFFLHMQEELSDAAVNISFNLILRICSVSRSV